jgi:hypothetical protein
MSRLRLKPKRRRERPVDRLVKAGLGVIQSTWPLRIGRRCGRMRGGVVGDGVSTAERSEPVH